MTLSEAWILATVVSMFIVLGIGSAVFMAADEIVKAIRETKR